MIHDIYHKKRHLLDWNNVLMFTLWTISYMILNVVTVKNVLFSRCEYHKNKSISL